VNGRGWAGEKFANPSNPDDQRKRNIALLGFLNKADIPITELVEKFRLGIIFFEILAREQK